MEEEPEPEGWDGWKTLLEVETKDHGQDFVLPDPITTPGYVPTPPRAELNKISV